MRDRRVSLVGVLSTGLLLVPAGAMAAAPQPAVLVQTHAWATVRNPAASYVPAVKDRGNLLGGGAVNVVHNGPGDYTVQFPSAAIAGQTGVAHVSALATTQRVCVVTSYGPTGIASGVDVDILCSRPGGVPDDSRFTVTYLAQTGGVQNIAYAYASHPGPNPYVVASLDSSSPIGGSARVRILGVGQYRVRLDGLGSADGDIQVTPVTTGSPRFCEVDPWTNNGGDLVADVRCYRPNGVLANARFTFSWNKLVGLKGDGGTQVAYTLGSKPGAVAPYAPPAPKAFNAAGAITIARSGVGRYKVTFAGQPNGGAAVVTPHGAAANRCFMSVISTVSASAAMSVGCVNGAGGAADTRFMISWLR
jgi:hypothetical protein